MFACPNCQARLTKQPSPEGPRWLCAVCGGRAIHLPSLRCTPAGAFVRRLWALARAVPAADRKRPCPICDRSMATVPTLAVPGSTEPLRLDLCTSCQFVWFDPTEHEAWVRSTALAATESRLPVETRAALARLSRDEPLAVELDERPLFQVVPRDESLELKYLFCILGLPVEVEAPPLRGRPWVTWMLIGLVTAVSVYAWIFLPRAPLEWGFVPAEMWRHGGLTLVTSFFLHDGFLHLLGNVYFLGIFGDNVEDLLGWRRYFVLVFVATVAGNLFQAGAQMTPRVPGIGASGGIAGVIVCYGLMFPHSRLRVLQFARIVEISVWGALALWVGIQFVSMIVQRADGVGYAAHVGGAFAGLIFWSLNRGREPAGILSIAGRS